MRKGKSVIGKPILSLADGARLHEVKDVILGADNDTVVGLLADEGGFLASSLVIPFTKSWRSGATRWSSPEARA